MNEVCFTLSFCKFCEGEGCFSIFNNKNFKLSVIFRISIRMLRSLKRKVQNEKLFFTFLLVLCF